MTTFRAACCREYGWTDGEYLRRIFFLCLRPAKRPAAWLLWPLRQRVFGVDLDAFERVGQLTEMSAVATQAAEFSDPRQERSTVQVLLHLRPSGRRLLAVAREVMTREIRSHRSDSPAGAPVPPPGGGPPSATGQP